MQTMPEQGGADATSKLASYRRCAQRIGQRWPAFTDRRRHRLRQGLFLQVGGAPDATRLPKAMQAILSNYRGAKVSIPRDAVGDVLVRLAGAARRLHKLPCQCADPSAAYVEAHLALVQLGRLADVGCCS